MYTVTETIEHENICVTAHPGIWGKGNELLWPPPGSGIIRKNIVTPGPDWISHTCRILRDNIETFEEALELEKMYSKHRDSDSFRKEIERKNLKRNHPVNFNNSDLINVNELTEKIDNATEKSAPKKATPNVRDAPSSQQKKSQHSRCFRQSNPIRKTVVSGLKNKHPNVKKFLKPEISKSKKRDGRACDEVRAPRYANYLQSGNKSRAPTSTITKAEFLKLDGKTTNGKEAPVREKSGLVVLSDSDKQERFGSDFDAVTHSGRDKAKSGYKSKIDIVDDILIKEGTSSSIHRSASFEENVLKSINNLKNAQKRADEQRLLFEARMIIKWDTFANEMMQTQGRTQSRGRRQREEPDRSEIDSVDPIPSAEDDFEDLDETFPIKLKPGVEEFEWKLRQDLDFKFRLKSRVNEFIADCPKKTIRLMLKYLIRDEALERYCWNGTAKKAAFKNLKAINKFIYSIISDNFKKFKKLQYEKYMGQWLKQSKGRQRIITYTYRNQRHETGDTDDDDDYDGETNENRDEDEESDLEN